MDLSEHLQEYIYKIVIGKKKQNFLLLLWI